MSDDRLIEIETKVLYQEDTIEQLNQVICKQEEQIQKIQAALVSLTKNFKSLMEMNLEVRPGHEKPPHY